MLLVFVLMIESSNALGWKGPSDAI